MISAEGGRLMADEPIVFKDQLRARASSAVEAVAMPLAQAKSQAHDRHPWFPCRQIAPPRG
jgi:hypothetical protein